MSITSSTESTMEAVGAIIGIADCTLRTTSKLWSVTSAWRDAPADLHRLRDDLSRTQRFFAETQEGINAMYALGSKVQGESHASWRELERLLDEGYAVLRQIEKFVDSLNRPSSGPSDESRELGKRRRIIWMTSVRKIQKLRDDLKGIVSNVCRLLIAQNVYAHVLIRSRDPLTPLGPLLPKYSSHSSGRTPVSRPE